MIDNGWFEKVRYMAAVSGGSWAAVPYIYADHDDETLLGKSYAPFQLDRQRLEARPADNSLMLAVTRSRVLAPGGVEAAKIIASQSAARRSDRTFPTLSDLGPPKSICSDNSPAGC
jgi:hypothetical protein